MSASEENKLNSGILLTSCLLHSFIQGIIVSQVGRYYEDYYHLDALSMKSYVGSIVVVSLYVCNQQHPTRNPEAYLMKPKSTDHVHQLQSMGGYPSPRRPESNGDRFHFSWFPPPLTPGVGTTESLDINGFILKRGPLRHLPYLPHQTVLESKRPIVTETVANNPVTKATNNNPWVLWTLSSLDAVVFVTIVIIVSEPPYPPRVDPV
jgi:hypothetical protein